MFIAEFHLHPVELHRRYFYLHGKVAQFRLVIHTKLVQFILAHLFLIQQLLIISLCTLQIQFQDGSTNIYGIATFTVDFHDACIYR